MTFLWTQTSGTPVALLNAGTATAAFVAPELDDNEVLTFQVQVSDALASSTDSVNITVRKGDGGGGGDDDGNDDGNDDGDGHDDDDDGHDDDGHDDDGHDDGIDDGCSASSRQTSLPFAMLFGLGLLVVRRRRR